MENKLERRIIFWLFLAPVLFAFAMVIVIPFLIGIYYSLTDWSASARTGAGLTFLGLQNFTQSLKDPGFIYSFGLTSVYTVVNMFVINVVAFFLAMMVTSNIKLRHVYRVGFFIPNLIGGLILGYIWQFVFNNALPAVGNFAGFLSFLANPDNLVLSKRASAVLAIVIAGTWQYAGYIMMIYVAALEGVPAELHEAADIDGANAWEKLRHITIPMVAQAFTVTMFLTLMNSFKQFDVNFSLTAGGPSTNFMGKSIYATELLALNIYNTAFIGNKLAMGQARAVIFFLVLVIIALIQVYANKKKEIEM